MVREGATESKEEMLKDQMYYLCFTSFSQADFDSAQGADFCTHSKKLGISVRLKIYLYIPDKTDCPPSPSLQTVHQLSLWSPDVGFLENTG